MLHTLFLKDLEKSTFMVYRSKVLYPEYLLFMNVDSFLEVDQCLLNYVGTKTEKCIQNF